MADATESLRTLRIAHAELQRRCRKQTKQLKDKENPSVGKASTLQAENASLRQRTKHLSQKLRAQTDHAERERQTLQRRSSCEVAGSGAVRAAEEFCKRAEDAEARTRAALAENTELQNHCKDLKSALTRQGKHFTFSGQEPAKARDALEAHLASEDVLGFAGSQLSRNPRSPPAARSPNLHDGLSEVWHTRYDQASKRLAEAERTIADQTGTITGLEQQISAPASPEVLFYGHKTSEGLEGGQFEFPNLTAGGFETFPPIEAGLSATRDAPFQDIGTPVDAPDRRDDASMASRSPVVLRDALPPIDDTAAKEREAAAAQRDEVVRAELRLIREGQEALARSLHKPAEAPAPSPTNDSAALRSARARAQGLEDALATLRSKESEKREKLEASMRTLREDLDARDVVVRALRDDIADRDATIGELGAKVRAADRLEGRLAAVTRAREEADARLAAAVEAAAAAEGRLVEAEARLSQRAAAPAAPAVPPLVTGTPARPPTADEPLAEPPVARTPARLPTADMPLSSGSDAPLALAAGPLSPRDPPARPVAVAAPAPARAPAASKPAVDDVGPPAEVSPDKTAFDVAARVDLATAAAFAAGRAAAAVNPPAPPSPRELPRVWWSAPGE